VWARGYLISDGNTTPRSLDGTWFGSIRSGQTVTRSFAVNNFGNSTLTLSPPQLPFGFVYG
jgi:hypothetical protein